MEESNKKIYVFKRIETKHLALWYHEELFPPIDITTIMNTLHSIFEEYMSYSFSRLLGGEKYEAIIHLWWKKETDRFVGIAEAAAIEDYNRNTFVLEIKKEHEEVFTRKFKEGARESWERLKPFI